jgi:hypothetical protein
LWVDDQLIPYLPLRIASIQAAHLLSIMLGRIGQGLGLLWLCISFQFCAQAMDAANKVTHHPSST